VSISGAAEGPKGAETMGRSMEKWDVYRKFMGNHGTFIGISWEIHGDLMGH